MRRVLYLCAMLAATWPLAARAETPAEPEPTVARSAADGRELKLSCRRWYGFAVGAYRTDDDWSQVGRPPWAPTISPMLGGACGPANSRGVHPFVGADAVPWYVHVRSDGEPIRQLASASTGVYFGGDVLRAGLYGTYGFPAYGGGVGVLVLTDRPTADSRGNGLEFRFTVYQVGSIGYQGMVVFTTMPRRKEG